MQLAALEPVSRQAVAPTIFILGITMRSGTHYLSDLLRQHPDCTVREPIVEDCLLYLAHPLAQYVESVNAYWKQAWNIGPEDAALFYKSLGDGIQAFLNANAQGKRVVTKTPTVENLDLFFKLFPDSPLLILVRDGRAVVESAGNTFEMSHEFTTRIWRDNARIILRFLRENQSLMGSKILLIRYEELFQNVRREMRKVLEFVGLSAESYDFDAAANLPVRGSSAFRGGQDKVHWTPVKRSADFNPLERYKDWSAAQHRRFNWLAGAELKELGYELYPVAAGAVGRFWDKVLDAKWAVKGWLQRNGTALRRRLLSIGKWVR
jgi:hypothetical protein